MKYMEQMLMFAGKENIQLVKIKIYILVLTETSEQA